MFSFIWWILLSWSWDMSHASIGEVSVTIDHDGFDTLECCAYGRCSCSSLALALEQASNNAVIRIVSSISLRDEVQFGNISNITITGYNSPTIMCDHQGGLLGNHFNTVTIQNIIWSKCNRTVINDVSVVRVVNCSFLHCNNTILTSGVGSVYINNSAFSDQIGHVGISAPFIDIHKSNFSRFKNSTLWIPARFEQFLQLSVINVTISDCNFNNNYGYSLRLSGYGIALHLVVNLSKFSANMKSAVYLHYCNTTVLHSVTFYNNTASDTNGGAISAIHSEIIIFGPAIFENNSVAGNGGALYLQSVQISMYEASVQFYNNAADNGGAMFLDENSTITTNKSTLMFAGNTAASYGGAVYVNCFSGNHDRDWLISSICVQNNTANKKDSCAYFSIGTNLHSDSDFLISSKVQNAVIVPSPHNINISHAVLHLNETDYHDDLHLIEFWLHQLQFDVVVTDYFGNLVGPVNGSVTCADEYKSNDVSNYYIDSINHNLTLINDSKIQCNFEDPFSLYFYVFDDSGNNVRNESKVVKQSGNCNADIAHIKFRGDCLPLDCNLILDDDSDIQSYLVQIGITCGYEQLTTKCGYVQLTTTPGYWYDNGFQSYVISCPIDHCKIYDLECDLEQNLKPDRNYQCLQYWTGLACGECNNNFSIPHDTTNCIPHSQCCSRHTVVNLFLLLFISFVYWCIVISLIFVLLHFRIDVTAGYAYGVIFYYSILEQIVNILIQHNRDIYHRLTNPSCIQGGVISTTALPFFSIIGILRPPFLKYINLCLGDADVIDHVFIGYVHPLIVTCVVGLIFFTARRFVVVARYVGRYVNSKSICILLLLSYSSVCYTSVQLLKPLAVFDHDLTVQVQHWQTYLSPTVQYFHGRHILYATIAILCELIIGIVLPLVILTQRYMIRYFNLKLISIKPIIDQLQGCYKEEYRWFAAYYLICRQVLYGTNIILDFVSAAWNKNAKWFGAPSPEDNTPSTVMLIIVITIVVIPLWLQPYKRRDLNILDSAILFTLVFLMISGLNGDGWDDGITMVLYILPLLFLINYLTLRTKLKYLVIPGSCVVVICMHILLTWFTMDCGKYDSEFDIRELALTLWLMGVFHIIILLASFFILIAFFIWALMYLCTKHQTNNYLPINRRDDYENSDEDDAINRYGMY